MESLPENQDGPSVGGPAPREILQTLRKAISEDSRLKTTPPEEIAKQLLEDGRLPRDTPLNLVYELLDVMRSGSFGLRAPELQPCSLEFHREDLDIVDLSLVVEWPGAPDLPEEHSLPDRLTHTETPSCTDLIFGPISTLNDKERRPIHVCHSEFLRQSSEVWVQQQQFGSDSVNVYRWASMHPLPIGRQSLMSSHEVNDYSEWAEVFEVLPFEGHEEALWALRIESEGSETTHTLDLFGLADYGSSSHAELGLPVAGSLAYVAQGYDSILIEVLAAAEKWWAQFRGSSLRGRPVGTGTWKSREYFVSAIECAVARAYSEGEKPTQEHIAQRLHTSDRQLREWLRQYKINWREIGKG